MTTITLDTNLLIELFDLAVEPRSVSYIGRIFRHGFDFQTIDLKITTAATDDLMADKNKERMEAMRLRVYNTFSVLGAGYVTVDFLPEDEVERKNFLELQKVLFPSLDKGEKRYKNKINDVHHLHRHIRSRRNVFVTNDSDILKKEGALLEAFGAVVMNPSVCADYLDALDSSSKYPSKKHGGRTDYYSAEMRGEVRFDFTNNDKKYTIGAGDMIFETQWSEGDLEKMYAYNDPQSIEALAVAEGVTKFSEVKEFGVYDSTSRVRMVSKRKDILLLKNTKDFYAAIKLIDIQLKSRGSSKNELVFEYVIQPDKSSTFKGLKK